MASSSSSSSKKSGFARFCSKLSVNKSREEEEERVIKIDSSSSLPSSSLSADEAERGKGGSECFERVFTYFDEDGDGRVSPAELQRGVRAIGGELTAEEAEMAVRLSDSDGDGLLGLEDFTKLMEVEEDRKEDELMEAFKMYEMEGTGKITPKSLKRMLGRLGEKTTTESCKAMIMRFDINGDGVLCFEEFKVMMQQA